MSFGVFSYNFGAHFQSVGQVHADDADDGINGEIYFSLMDPKSSFAVDPVTGVISLTRPLSYQKKPRHEITVVAQDRGAKSRFATRAPDTATVHLSVRQVRAIKLLNGQTLVMSRSGKLQKRPSFPGPFLCHFKPF